MNAPSSSVDVVPVRNSWEELRALVRLAWPLALGQAGWAVMTFVDTVLLGQVGQAELGGGGLGGSLFFSLTVLGMGLTLGFDPLMSQAVGAGDHAKARAWMWQAVYLATAAGLVLALPLLLVRLHLVSAGVDGRVAAQASDYLLWRAPSMPFVLLFTVMRGYLQAVGRTRIIGVAAVVANVTNVLGDLLLIRGGASLPAWTGPLQHIPPMGAGGSAIATAFSTVVQLLMAAAVVTRIRDGRQRPPKLDWPALGEGLRVGGPVALQMGAEVGVFALASFLAARMSAASSAAHQVAISFASLSFNIALGIGEAGSARVGWAVGARDSVAVRRSGGVAFLLGGGVMTVSAAVFVLAPEALLAMFGIDSQVAMVATPLMRIAGVFQIFDGLQAVGAGVLRGAGDTAFTSAANIVGHYLLGLPVSLALGFGAGWAVSGLWVGLCVGLAAVAVSLVVRFVRLAARTIEPLPQ